MRLWVRLAAVIAAVAIALVAITGVAAMRTSSARASESSRTILVRDAQTLAAVLGSWTDDQVTALSGWVRPFSPDLGPDHLRGLQVAVYQAMPGVITVAVVDVETGRARVAPQYASDRWQAPERVLGSPQRAVALLRRLPISEVEGGGAALGEPYLPPGAEVPSLPVAVCKPGSQIALGAELGLDAIGEMIVRQHTPAHGAALLDATGRPVFGGDHPLVEGGRLRSLLGTDAYFDLELSSGRAVSGAVAAVPHTSWTVVVVEPAEYAARAALAIRRRTVELVLISFVLALVAGGVLARSLSDPVQRLRDSANAVADGDFGRRVPVVRSDELGDLARAFNHMSERLEENARELRVQQAEIESFNRELQQRVMERTRELEQAQQRLVQSGQLAAVAQVGAGLAHELNNPLTGLLGLTQLLRSRARDPGEEQMLSQIEVQAERCREVVATMLRFVGGEVDPRDATVVDIRDVLRDVVELVRGPFRQSEVALGLRAPDEILHVCIDAVAASRILVQILDSLRAGLPRGASLDVSAVGDGDEVVVVLSSDRPVAMGESRDDWMASGMSLWVARRLLADKGGRIEDPTDPNEPWRVVLPGGGMSPGGGTS